MKKFSERMDMEICYVPAAKLKDVQEMMANWRKNNKTIRNVVLNKQKCLWRKYAFFLNFSVFLQQIYPLNYETKNQYIINILHIFFFYYIIKLFSVFCK